MFTAMHRVSIQPRWTIRSPDGSALAERTVALLVGVADHGSLLKACRSMQVSYRHAWQIIRQGEQLLGAPLLRMERGKGSSLSPLAESLVWADRRIAARLSPTLDSLASELQAQIGGAASLVIEPIGTGTDPAPLLIPSPNSTGPLKSLHCALTVMLNVQAGLPPGTQTSGKAVFLVTQR